MPLMIDIAPRPMTAPPPRVDFADAPALERARGEVRITVKSARGGHRLAGLRQSGSAKARLPRTPSGQPLEAILLNTAGGVTGGDRLAYHVALEEGAAAVVTSQAAERAYRSRGDVGHIETRLELAAGSRLDWLPQETILFERSALARRFDADLDATATLLAAEAVVLGRTAMGESLRDILFTDTWRIRRDSRLVFADNTRLDGDAETVMAGKATGGGAGAFATVLLVAPQAEAALETARGAMEHEPCECGASAWNGVLVARILAAGGKPLRAGLVRLIEALRQSAMPRVWNC